MNREKMLQRLIEEQKRDDTNKVKSQLFKPRKLKPLDEIKNLDDRAAIILPTSSTVLEVDNFKTLHVDRVPSILKEAHCLEKDLALVDRVRIVHFLGGKLELGNRSLCIPYDRTEHVRCKLSHFFPKCQLALEVFELFAPGLIDVRYGNQSFAGRIVYNLRVNMLQALEHRQPRPLRRPRHAHADVGF